MEWGNHINTKGSNAIAQWNYTLQSELPQGLGTGGLFTNNTPSNLMVKGDYLWLGE